MFIRGKKASEQRITRYGNSTLIIGTTYIADIPNASVPIHRLGKISLYNLDTGKDQVMATLNFGSGIIQCGKKYSAIKHVGPEDKAFSLGGMALIDKGKLLWTPNTFPNSQFGGGKSSFVIDIDACTAERLLASPSCQSECNVSGNNDFKYDHQLIKGEDPFIYLWGGQEPYYKKPIYNVAFSPKCNVLNRFSAVNRTFEALGATPRELVGDPIILMNSSLFWVSQNVVYSFTTDQAKHSRKPTSSENCWSGKSGNQKLTSSTGIWGLSGSNSRNLRDKL